jgi:hypothetical protein
VYGSEKEKTAARSKLKKFERDNKEAIERNRAQEFGGSIGSGIGAGGMELVVPESQPIAPNNELLRSAFSSPRIFALP